MSTNLPIVALVGLVAGVGGAGLSSVLLPGPAEAPAPALSATAPAVDLSGIEERLDRFASRLDEVEMQVAAAPTRRVAAPSPRPHARGRGIGRSASRHRRQMCVGSRGPSPVGGG